MDSKALKLHNEALEMKVIDLLKGNNKLSQIDIVNRLGFLRASVHLYCTPRECRDNDSDAELWKREEFAGLDHHMLWLEGKNRVKKDQFLPYFFARF